MFKLMTFVLLLVCFVCVLQATPLPQGENQSSEDQFTKLKNQISEATENLGKQVKDAFSNIDMNEQLNSAKDFIEKAAENVRKELEKIVKND